MAIPVNPPAAQLGLSHAILWGRGNRRYHVGEFPGPLSIKTMIRGRGEWQGSGSSHAYHLDGSSGGYLLFNEGQPYSITIESRKPVETFCVFFRRGFVEDAWRTATTAPSQLLDDDAGSSSAPIEFREGIRARDTLLSPLTARLHAKISRGEEANESDLEALAHALLWLRPEYERMLARLPAVKSATKVELGARLQRARAFLDDSLGDSSVTLSDAAREACLSPFHLQRSFRQLFGETPRDYLSRRRLEAAARLLSTRDLPVTEVCLECGFESLGSFSTAFKQRFHIPPRAYREKFAIGEK